jgi:hypothetical protein
VKPAGPTDPVISILAVREPNGRPIAAFSAYSLHYVGGVGPGHISADYYGMYCRRLERLWGQEHQDPPAVAMMANGTSGDVNNINFLHPRPAQGPYVQMRAVADDVAAKIHKAIIEAQYRDNVTLGACYRELTVAGRQPTAEQIQWAKKTLADRPQKPGQGVDLPAIYADRVLRLAQASPENSVPLQVFRIGDVCIGTMPCEVFCEIGLEFKKRCARQPAFLVSLAHGYLGYLPTPQQHALGGYETWLGTCRLEPHASEKMLEVLLQMATETGQPVTPHL